MNNKTVAKIVDNGNVTVDVASKNTEGETTKFSYNVSVMYKQLCQYYSKLFGIFSRHQTSFEISLIVYRWIQYLSRSSTTASNFYSKLALSICQLTKFGIVYICYYKFRTSVVKRWENGASPKISLDFSGCYSVLKNLFALKTLFELNLPNLFTLSININLKSYDYRNEQEITKCSTNNNTFKKMDSRAEKKNEEEILSQHHDEKRERGDILTGATLVTVGNNVETKSTIPTKNKMPVNPLLSQIRQFNNQSLTPPRKKMNYEINDNVNHENTTESFIPPPKGGNHSIFADLAAGLRKRRARLSTAVFKTKDALASRDIYDDFDGDSDGDISSDEHRWSTGTDENAQIFKPNKQINNNKNNRGYVGSIKTGETENVSNTNKIDTKHNNPSRIMTPDLVNMFSPPVKLQQHSNSKLSSKVKDGNHSKLCNSVDFFPEANGNNVEAENNAKNDENSNTENINENIKVDKRLSINNENIFRSVPHKKNGRRSRSRRHLIYVPSPLANNEIAQ